MYIECDVFHVHGMYLNGIYGNKINKYFNVGLLDFYITQILTSTTVIIECISWLIKVTDPTLKKNLFINIFAVGCYFTSSSSWALKG
jgi:hypothetical protein